jgi:ASC-1-like (ASCH) protein
MEKGNVHEISNFVLIIVLSVGCIEKPETSVPEITKITLPSEVNLTTKTITNKVIDEVQRLLKSKEEIRLENEQEYYTCINEHYSEFEPYLREGRYTQITPKIKALADELWETEEIYTKRFHSDNPVGDYIDKSLYYIFGEIKYPAYPDFVSERYYNERGIPIKEVLTGQKSADWILKNKIGYCDEVCILYCALMKAKGIPCKIKIYSYPVAGWHSVVEVWYNNTWWERSPSPIPEGMSKGDRVDVTYKDTIFMSDVERW